MTDDHPTRSDPADRPGAAADVVRSEEHLAVATHVREVGRVRIAKRVVTEQRVITVDVRREELVVEELPVDPHHDALVVEGGGLSGDARSGSPVVEMWLSEEEVEVTARVVPKERVRVYVDTLTDVVEVGGTVAREVVEVDGTGRGA